VLALALHAQGGTWKCGVWQASDTASEQVWSFLAGLQKLYTQSAEADDVVSLCGSGQCVNVAVSTLRMASMKKLRVYQRVVMAAVSASVGYLSSMLKPSHGGVPRIASRSVAANMKDLMSVANLLRCHTQSPCFML